MATPSRVCTQGANIKDARLRKQAMTAFKDDTFSYYVRMMREVFSGDTRAAGETGRKVLTHPSQMDAAFLDVQMNYCMKCAMNRGDCVHPQTSRGFRRYP